jgi:hypothetical protein
MDFNHVFAAVFLFLNEKDLAYQRHTHASIENAVENAHEIDTSILALNVQLTCSKNAWMAFKSTWIASPSWRCKSGSSGNAKNSVLQDISRIKEAIREMNSEAGR